ncbi:AfsR/SARP family transcriptional regulator [Amycolatopsis sp. NBC_01286]|uniref:AfsR/SARP family transcriptional regulator n=1 Tax=Amycolatopsis sp. NBC_01286 TaxID=2903560 RepID=UPI002E152328|nr:NB-ARC domain-containing protein [Amycolatopsis sp. NBC_01286]
MTESVRFEVLGPVRAWRGDVELELGPPQQRAALAVLLLQDGTSLSPAQLVEALWGGAEPRAATGMVRSYISRLRHALEPDTPIKSIGGGYAIIAPTLDLTEFQHLLTTGDAASLRAALDLWHGAPLSGVNGFEAERVRLEQLRLKAIEDLAAADIEAGHHAGAISALTELITEQPMRERPRELQMLALYRSGRQAEALDVFAHIQRRLEDELGLYPGPELREMQRRILSSDPTLAATITRPTQLPPQLSEFVGREDMLTALADTLRTTGPGVPVVGVEGLAGIGKTTLAIQLGHKITTSFPDGQLFTDLSVSPDPLSELLRGIGVTDLPPSSSERAALWRTRTTGRRVLIVLDDAQAAEQIRPLLPGTGGPAVMITARQRLYGLPHAHWQKLQGLDPTASLQLLSRLIGPRTDHDRAATEELVARTAGLPQVLQAVGARVSSRPEWTMPQALSRLGRPAPDSPVTPPECRAIEKPYESAMAQLTPAQSRAFRALSHLAMPVVPLSAAAETLNLELPAAAAILESLVDAHLLDPAGPDAYRYQEPLREFARSRAGQEDWIDTVASQNA